LLALLDFPACALAIAQLSTIPYYLLAVPVSQNSPLFASTINK
jgi:hypothetical protein